MVNLVLTFVRPSICDAIFCVWENDFEDIYETFSCIVYCQSTLSWVVKGICLNRFYVFPILICTLEKF